MSDGQPEGQLQGDLTSHFWIVPLRGAVDRVRLLEYGIQLGAGLRTMQMSAGDISISRRSAKLPPEASLLQAGGEIVVTSVREVEGAVEVRLFNPRMVPAAASLDFRGRPKSSPAPRSAQRVNLESQPLGRPLALRHGILRLTVRPKEIVTLRFSF
jgi:alpha-mannosidase/mannosylglycerate hydrolase